VLDVVEMRMASLILVRNHLPTNRFHRLHREESYQSSIIGDGVESDH